MGPLRQERKTVLKVVAVSPGDVQLERDLLEKVVSELNRGLAGEFELVLELWRWETDSYPGLHLKGPQGLIDNLMRLEESEIVVGIFWKRFGTPTGDARSGTEHELRRAWASWQKEGHPQVFVYFNQAPYYPQSPEEAEQWAAVLKFRSELPKEQLYWSYIGISQFEDLVRAHLTNFLRQRQKPENVQRAPSGIFSAPRFSDAIMRRELISGLSALALRSPTISIEGIPGSGKTYLAASYINHEDRHPAHRSALWYHAPLNSTLDDMFMQLSAILDFKSLSIESKCRALLSYLRDVSSVLVIDDFHQADEESYFALLEASNEYGNPSTIILTSRTCR
jgi:AAA domain